jgi:hypothetical protein
MGLPCLVFAEDNPESNALSEFEKSINPEPGFFQRILRNSTLKAEYWTPEQQQQIIDASINETFVGNPTLRTENSDIYRPAKQVALQIMDGEIGIVQTFMAFQAAGFLNMAAGSVGSRKVLAKARQVMSSLTPTETGKFQGALGRFGILSRLKNYLSNPSPAMKKFLRAEKKFAMMAVIGSMITMGIYDGLDVNGIKDGILAMDPMELNYSVTEGIAGAFFANFASRHLYKFFNDSFDVFYEKMLNSKAFGAEVVRLLDQKAGIKGRRWFRATRDGGVTHTRATFAQKMGLVGVGEGTQFTLKGLLRQLGAGLAFGLAGQTVVNGALLGFRGYDNSVHIGANRNYHSYLGEYPEFLYQKVGDQFKDGLNERKYAYMDWIEDQILKQPLTHVMGMVSAFGGAYIGSVAAGAIFLGATPLTLVGGVMVSSLFGGIGAWVGGWSMLKIERSDAFKNFRRKLHEATLYSVILKMDIYTSGRISEDEAKQLALDRSWDMHKLEAKGQVYSRMFLVEDFSKVITYKAGDYTYMKVEQTWGEPFDMQAHQRYALVDIKGDEALWDMLTHKLYNVGKVQDNDGFKIVFITDNEKIFFKGDFLDPREGGDFRILSNGLFMGRSDYDSSKWVIRSQDINTDLFMRNANTRYFWDTSTKAFRKVGTLSPDVARLQPFLQVFKGGEPEAFVDRLKAKTRSLVDINLQTARTTIEELTLEKEAEFFLHLEDEGVSHLLIENFLSMESSEWKTFLLGKIARRMPSNLRLVLDKLTTISPQELESSLQEELKNSQIETVWDAVAELLEPYSFIASFAK